MSGVQVNDQGRVAGHLTITRFKDSARETVGTFPNKVVNGDGYGRNLLARKLAGDDTYSIAIDSAAIGTDNTAAADAQTGLIAPTVSGLTITNRTATGAVLNVDVFVPDMDLPNGTYKEFGLFCNGRLFARVVISPSYTKGSGEDTLFSYQLTLT